MCRTLRVSDIAELGTAAAGEEVQRVDLAAVVRDHPDATAHELERLGYVVTRPVEPRSRPTAASSAWPPASTRRYI